MRAQETQSEYVGTSGAAVFLGVSESLLEKMRIGLTTDPGPRHSRIGTKYLYSKESLREYMSARLSDVR